MQHGQNIDREPKELLAKAGFIVRDIPEGCITQIASGLSLPVVHTVELLDWASGGPLPERLKAAGFSRA